MNAVGTILLVSFFTSTPQIRIFFTNFCNYPQESLTNLRIDLLAELPSNFMTNYLRSMTRKFKENVNYSKNCLSAMRLGDNIMSICCKIDIYHQFYSQHINITLPSLSNLPLCMRPKTTFFSPYLASSSDKNYTLPVPLYTPILSFMPLHFMLMSFTPPQQRQIFNAPSLLIWLDPEIDSMSISRDTIVPLDFPNIMILRAVIERHLISIDPEVINFCDLNVLL